MSDASGPSVDLSGAAAIQISQAADDRARISWRAGARWHEFELLDADSGYVDPEDVLWWMLRHEAPVDLVRDALGAAFPEFDLDAELNHTTMPDPAEQRAEDNERRETAKAAHRRAWPFTVTVEHFVDAGDRDAAGQYDYYYEGDIYTFDDGTQQLKLRTYTDSPTEASTVGLRSAALSRSPLADAASQYLAARGITTVRALGPSGTYERWLPDAPST